MARASKTDFLQNFRFHVVVAGGVEGLADTVNSTHVVGAGFQSVTLPELTVEGTEYREGTYKYAKKFPGVPTVSDVTLIRGVTAQHTLFFRWAMAAVSGAEYRADIAISQYHRHNVTGNTGAGEASTLPTAAARTYTCHECTPIRVKPGADLDATSGEVAMQELDFSLEWFEVATTDAGDGAGLPTATA